MRYKYLLLLLALLALNTPISAEYFRHIGLSEGLTQPSVMSIHQDQLGRMWFGTREGINLYDGKQITAFKGWCNASNDSAPIWLGNEVSSIVEDKQGNIFFLVDDDIIKFDIHTEQFSRLSKGSRIPVLTSLEGDLWYMRRDSLFKHSSGATESTFMLKTGITSPITCLTMLPNKICIGSHDGIFFYDRSSGKETHVLRGIDIYRIFESSQKELWIGTRMYGLYRINKKGEIRQVPFSPGSPTGISSWQIRDFVEDGERNIWFGTFDGLHKYSTKTGQYSLIQIPKYVGGLNHPSIFSLCKDMQGTIWVGSYFGGVNYYPRSYTYFEKYYPKGIENSLHGKRVREFCRDSQGILWIGTEDGGLNRFNLKTKDFSFFAPSAGFTNIHGLCLVDDKLWVGTFSKGLKVIDTRSGVVLKTYQKNDSPRSLIDNSIFAICKTATGDIYLGTMFGLVRYNKQSDDFDRIPELNGKFIYDIKEDSAGNIWLATYANGVYCYNVNDRKWKNYVHDDKDNTSLPYNKVSSVFEDSHRQIWLTTQGGGFCIFHPESETFTSYNSTNGLPSDVVYQIVEDKEGQLWLTTNNGLVCFQPNTEAMKVYTTANGLLGDQFNYRSSFEDENGMIYFGGIDGFIAFNPKDFSENKNLPTVVITDFLLFNKEVYADEPNSPLEKSITFSDKIVLRADQNSFSFRISALGYQAPRMNKLKYKLEGFDDEWLSVGESPLITYSNLRYGHYIFRVKAANSNGVWNSNEISLSIQILPPFYLSVWAYCIYVLLIIGCSVYLVLYFKRRTNRKHRRQMEKFEQEKEREVYNAKIDFFTNVAHEIRTPLTLINGPLENILLKKSVDSETREDLNIMKQNTERLLSLTNQLLDFRKTESQGFRLNFAECNITEVLKETHKRFTSLAKQRELDFILNVPVQDFYAHVNKEAFTKIVSNLLNNAVKYAETYVHVYLEINGTGENKMFYIRSVNDGVIIPNEMKEEIFKPFVRFNEKEDGKVTTGTGIGLALSRSLAELHRGNLTMLESEEANVFCLSLPVEQDSVIKLASEHKSVEESKTVERRIEQGESKANRPVILVADDNQDMLSFVVRQLEDNYIVLTAKDGLEALEVLDNQEVTLVVSDVVMPRMDGFELCKVVKSKLDYSHIPVILLTAKTNIQSKIEGLELGADAYIEKPFSVEYLQACIANLINSREKLRQAFAQSPFVAANTMALTKADEEFIKRLNEVIQINYGNPEFSMDDMADKLNMSRSNFYRKIKGVLDLSPNEFLRLERLKKAAQLLKEGENRVNEICYMVGFNSPSYFAKCFQKQFGVLPKDFVNSKEE